MQAATRHRYGGPDVVQVEEVERPVPSRDEVLVRVQAASINRADLDLLYPRPGFLRPMYGVRAPRSPRIGADAAGIVEAIGPDVTRFRPGDRVFADLFPFGSGSFAELAKAPERAWLPIPDGVSTEDAATLPHAGVLAIQGLRRRDGRTIGPGDRVLIDGASGNVGPFAVQIAKARGAEVTGVASGSKLDFVSSLGADHVVDYREVDYTSRAERYDWILAADSHHRIHRLRRVLRPGGAYVTLGGNARDLAEGILVGPVATLATGKWLGLMLWWRPFAAEDVATLTGLLQEGVVRPRIHATYQLRDVAEALREVDDGRSRGKVLLEIPG